MKKILITGVSGFVGQHLLTFLSTKPGLSVQGIDVDTLDSLADYPGSYEYSSINMLDKESLFELIRKFDPDAIIHLASSSSVAYSWKNPNDCFKNNTNIFLNLIEAVRLHKKNCKILSIGSSEEYGKVDVSSLPLTEEVNVNPSSPYGVSRVSQEMLSKVYVTGYGLDIVMTRSFNHTGPGQDNRFFIPDFASQLMKIKKNATQNGPDTDPVINVGDLTVVRDFTDVRDVVKAYWLLLKHGRKGEIYNVCSGTGYSLSQLAKMMNELSAANVRIQQDSDRIRPAENPVIIGSNEKLSSETGWKPMITIETSLEDVLNYWHGKS